MEIVRADLRDAATLHEAVKGVEYVFHVAGVTKAKRRSEFYEGNVVATQNLLEAASCNPQLKKFCLVSSLTAVGPSRDGIPLDEETPCHPITAYGESKLEAEQLCRRFDTKLPYVVIRPPTVYGPRDQDVLEAFRWVSRGIEPIIGASQKHISLVHVADLTRGILEATLSEKTTGETYFITDELIYDFSRLVAEIASQLRKRTVRVRIPGPVVFAFAAVTQFSSILSSSPPVLNIDKARDLVQPHWVCTSKKLRNHIGFETRVSLSEGFREVAEWYKRQGWLR